jgi:hypothetical protein
MRKYAADLQSYDQPLVDGRTLILDFIEYNEHYDAILVIGYFDDDGEPFVKMLDPDEEMVIV